MLKSIKMKQSLHTSLCATLYDLLSASSFICCVINHQLLVTARGNVVVHDLTNDLELLIFCFFKILRILGCLVGFEFFIFCGSMTHWYMYFLFTLRETLI